MPLIAALALVFVVLVAVIVLMPVTLIQRYRVGTARRLARGWVATLNLLALVLSTGMFLTGAAVTNAWVPDAFKYALMGLAGGGALGVIGLALSRWESTPRTLHYTPSRSLVLAITLLVTSRVLYGFWRSWHAWRSALDGTDWLAASGVAGSLAAGAVVLGYYLVYWAGVRRRLRRHQARWHGRTDAAARVIR